MSGVTAKPDEKPCGCSVIGVHIHSDTPEIVYCPLHAAAGQMAEALEAILEDHKERLR